MKAQIEQEPDIDGMFEPVAISGEQLGMGV